MQIDGFTFVAQIVNFLILVALLRLFLYKPVVNAMDERERKITERLEEAARKRKEAEKEAESYRRERQKLEDERAEILTEAKEEARGLRRQLLEEARAEAEEARARWKTTIQKEQESFLEALRRRICDQVMAIARRALADLADAGLEQQMVNRFVARVRALDGEDRAAIIKHARQSGRGIVITSAFELSPEMREQLAEMVRGHVEDELEVRFQTESDLLCGVALRLDGHEVSWSLSSYLQSLDARVMEVIEEETLRTNETAAA